MVVAGATGALGAAVVSRLLADGRTVAALHRPGAADRIGAGAHPIACDLRDPAQVEGLRARLEGLGVWTGCVVASGGYAGGAAHELDDAAVDGQLELNLLGPWRLARAAAGAMLAAGTEGRIVVTLGRAAVDVAAGQAGYQVAKAAAARLVEVMALELRDSGITVNAVMPSTMDTAANRAAMPRADHSRWVPTDRVAAVISWLLSPEAGDTSGALLPVYGRA